ncbi:hypothetical protein LCGC14_2067080 [marine sediment metagenome]|uniref:Uncharacterized protein n=1 Tax=marine sediment metagenome TaxID=412755 RepID=A0A0F9EJE1_9ZZZZ
MSNNYLEKLTKCKKCGYCYSKAEYKTCPHNFRNKLSRLMMGQEKNTTKVAHGD